MENNNIYHKNIVNIESLFSTMKTIVPLTLLSAMLEYWAYSLIPIATILFIVTIISSFISLIFIIGYIKFEMYGEKILPNISHKMAELSNVSIEHFLYKTKVIIHRLIKLSSTISNLSFLSAVILILITILSAI